ncbi:hypothetical protein NH340_JMT07200 [Sarcoptes scabiei]|nr:hypothetical protein NH340_JMT07200 [Sarcoptes scabiei]
MFQNSIKISFLNGSKLLPTNVIHQRQLIEKQFQSSVWFVLTNYNSKRFGRRYRRWYHWPNDFLPFHWERKRQDPPCLCTGDLVRDIGLWDSNALVPGAEHSKELENAPEIVRRQFSLGFASRAEIVQYQLRKIIEKVRRHPFDTNSPEVKIAEYTVHIRNNLHHFTKIDKDDARRKISQEALKNRRIKMLIDLYYQDRERYDRLVQILGIDFKIPELGVVPTKPTRKGELRRLTKEYCEQIKMEKLDKYHQELLSKQKTLELDLEKIQNLIKEDKNYLGISNRSNDNGNIDNSNINQ